MREGEVETRKLGLMLKTVQPLPSMQEDEVKFETE